MIQKLELHMFIKYKKYIVLQNIIEVSITFLPGKE